LYVNLFMNLFRRWLRTKFTNKIHLLPRVVEDGASACHREVTEGEILAVFVTYRRFCTRLLPSPNGATSLRREAFTRRLCHANKNLYKPVGATIGRPRANTVRPYGIDKNFMFINTVSSVQTHR